MKDLREQLAARFGQPVPEPEPASPPQKDDPLGPQAHHASEWLALLKTLGPSVGQPVKRDASLSAAKQVTDRTLKALKAAGRKRDGSTLDKARSDYLKKREKLAWGRLKDDIAQRGGSPKAYRALKQSKTDPEQALKKLKRLSEDVGAMGANRLRDALS